RHRVEGSLHMVVDCENGQRVYGSRDMRQRGRRHSGHSQPCGPSKNRSGVSQKESLRVYALITATIEEGGSCCALREGMPRGKKRATALCLWVTDSNRTFFVGPVAVDNAARWKTELKDCGM
ncbi:trans-sialidase, partial [Trypanosoma cruzi]